MLAPRQLPTLSGRRHQRENRLRKTVQRTHQGEEREYRHASLVGPGDRAPDNRHRRGSRNQGKEYENCQRDAKG